ncbi:uncharacterized protein LOC115891379 [Sitophilus oryzae]|uniref:Uncharacterized protein LOC115891379 n=1 Tax=Sitophilus oryzae TaxID=7048 RepID=A0A6J2YWW2_SITOR|nr:uncharacterized protein LOC115891379 [Sitophilus oryzae]
MEDGESKNCGQKSGKGLKQQGREENNKGQPEREILRLPPITVDQLPAFRKKKPDLILPEDNLRLPDGSFKDIKTEYEREFKGYDKNFPDLTLFINRRIPGDHVLKLEGDHEFHTEYEDAYRNVLERLGLKKELKVIESDTVDDLRLRRPELVKRSTNLRLEGELSHITNYAESFIWYLLTKRTELQRKGTTLRLEGDMDHMTENRNSFVPYDNVIRPPLCKRFTNLHLSGSFHMDTENRENFLPFKVQRPYQFSKMPTNLHLEGTLFLEPEYKSSFIRYQNYERPQPVLPHDQIKSPVEFSDASSSSSALKHPLIPYLRTSDIEEHRQSRSRSRHNSRPSSRSVSQPSRPTSRSSSRSPLRLHIRPPSRSFSRPSSRTENLSKFKHMESDDEESKDLCKNRFRKSFTSGPKIHNLGTGKNKEISQRNTDRIIKYTKTLAPNMAANLSSPIIASRDPSPNRRLNMRTKAQKRDWNPAALQHHTVFNHQEPEQFDGRFECQPEYRRAYMNYLVREKVENKQQLIKRPGSESKGFSTSEDASDNAMPSYSQNIKNKKPPINRKSEKKIELMETKVFGQKCRHISESGTTSSEDIFLNTKRSQIPRPISLNFKRRKDGETSEENNFQPAFVLI